MSQNRAAQLTLEVRRIRKSARAGFIDDMATCFPESLVHWTGVGAAKDVVNDSAANEKPVDDR